MGFASAPHGMAYQPTVAGKESLGTFILAFGQDTREQSIGIHRVGHLFVAEHPIICQISFRECRMQAASYTTLRGFRNCVLGFDRINSPTIG